MRKTITLLLFLVTTTLCCYGQISVELNLPDPCQKLSTKANSLNQNSFDVMLTPNPSDGKIRVQVTSDEVINELILEVHNLKGIVVFKEKLFCNSSSFLKNYNWSNLSPGLYVLKLESKGKHNQEKFIIK